MSIVSGSLGAVMGADATTEAANTAANAARDTSAESNKLQREIYNDTKDRFAPYMAVGPGALSRMDAMNSGEGIASDAQYQKYLAELNGMADPTKYLTDANAIYDNPIYKFQRDEANKNLSRSLRSLGRENSTYGMNAIGKQNNQLAADSMNQLIGLDNSKFSRLSGLAGTRYASLADQYNRLRDLAGSGQAAAGLTSNAASNYGSNVSSTLANMGNTIGNSALLSGQAKSGLLSGIGGASAGAANVGLKAYDLYNKYNTGAAGAGAINGATAGNSYGVMASDANMPAWTEAASVL